MKQFQPVFFRLSCEKEKTQYQLLLEEHPEIEVLDTIEYQVKELIKITSPTRKFSEEEITSKAQKKLGPSPIHYGIWVYYPWLNKIIHLLDKEDFVKVRTNRNNYKISPEEQKELGQKKIGLIGLSVGHAVALTMAQERIFGELRIADFDELDLSNLNRIRTGVQNIGLKKVYVVAREISEIDPFLKIEIYNDGINESNIDDFLLKNGKLDLLIDECDGLDIKIKCRERAKAHSIPVIMETSDRGMLDIERFDLDPERPILHGLVDGLNSNNLKDLSNEEKIPFIFPMIEMQNSSVRLKASMFEIEQTISTWPQLASDVTLGGASATNVARRILLNQLSRSGRFFIDLNEIIANKPLPNNNQEERIQEEFNEHTILNTIKEIELVENKFALNLNEEVLSVLLKAANSAPSGGNSQPWFWVKHNKRLFLSLRKERASSLLDYKYSGALIALGAAVRNLKLKANELGLEFYQNYIEQEKEDFLVHSCFTFREKEKDYDIPFAELSYQIDHRKTDRLNEQRRELPIAFINKLAKLSSEQIFTTLKVKHKQKDIEDIGLVIRNCDKIRIMNKRGHSELMNEIRWTESENQKLKDGIDIETLDLSPADIAGLNISKNWEVIKFLKDRNKGNGFLKLSEKSIDNSSALGLVCIPQESPFQYFNAGKFIEDIWLCATEFGVGLQPLTASLFMMKRAFDPTDVQFNSKEKKALLEQLENLKGLFNLKEGQIPAFLFRFSISDAQPKKSLRRKLNNSLIVS